MKRKEKVATKEYTYTAVFEPAEEGGYVVTFPALPGCATQGESLEEARAMAADALRGYLEILVEEGRPLPPDAPEVWTEPIRAWVSAEPKTA